LRNCSTGGDDITDRTLTYFARVFQKKTGKDMTADTEAMARLRKEVETAKEALSTAHSARIELEALYDGHELKETLTRERFEKINDSLFKKTLAPLETLLEEGDLKSADAIDE
jgi:heat shock protein 5